MRAGCAVGVWRFELAWFGVKVLTTFWFENGNLSPDWRGRCDPSHHELPCDPLPSINTNFGEGERFGVQPLASAFLKASPCWVYRFYRHQSSTPNLSCALFGDTEHKWTCITEAASNASHTVSRNLQRNMYPPKTLF